jgi:uncharacterized tellurite resistance protein B-like protein
MAQASLSNLAYPFDRLAWHIDGSRRILNDLRTLRRLLWASGRIENLDPRSAHLMLKALKRVLAGTHEDTHPAPAQERRQLQLAVAVLLHEARRADYAEGSRKESAVAEAALAEIFNLGPEESAALLEQGGERAGQLTSFYAPVTVVKREFSMPERIRLVEHLWRVAFAEGGLDLYEDHYVRKIARLLYVPNTESMLARNRARG